MPKFLARITALLLISCLIIDPSWMTSVYAVSQAATCYPPIPSVFAEQTMANAALPYLHALEPPASPNHPIYQLITEARTRPQVAATSVKPGTFLLVSGMMGYKVTEVDRVEFKNEPAGKWCNLYSSGRHLDGSRALQIVARESTEVWSGLENPLFVEGKATSDSVNDFKAWPLTEEEAKSLLQFRKASRRGSTIRLTRDEMAIYAALQGMEFMRWPIDELEREVATHQQQYPRHVKMLRERAANPAMRAENFGQAIGILIKKYGKAAIVKSVETIFVNHLDRLDIGGHYKAHSDLDFSDEPLMDEAYVKLGHEAIGNAYPLPGTFYGYGDPCNTKTLFGDVNFWEYLRNHQVDIYLELRRFVEAETGPPAKLGHKDTILGVMQRHFPEAYTVVNGLPAADKALKGLNPDLKNMAVWLQRELKLLGLRVQVSSGDEGYKQRDACRLKIEDPANPSEQRWIRLTVERLPKRNRYSIYYGHGVAKEAMRLNAFTSEIFFEKVDEVYIEIRAEKTKSVQSPAATAKDSGIKLYSLWIVGIGIAAGMAASGWLFGPTTARVFAASNEGMGSLISRPSQSVLIATGIGSPRVLPLSLSASVFSLRRQMSSIFKSRDKVLLQIAA